MSEAEWRGRTSEESIRYSENSDRRYKEKKYAFQVGLKDLDFVIDEDKIKALGKALPFQTISQAEEALCSKCIIPRLFIEEDETMHQVLVFDHRPIGYSGFKDCVTHSLALTDKGLFEVGRYPAVSLSSQSRYWQWFLHRRLATSEEFSVLCEKEELTSGQLVEKVYQAFVSR